MRRGSLEGEDSQGDCIGPEGGKWLSENDDDALSHRLAVIALSGPDRETLVSRYERAVELLSFELVPLRVASPSQ